MLWQITPNDSGSSEWWLSCFILSTSRVRVNTKHSSNKHNHPTGRLGQGRSSQDFLLLAACLLLAWLDKTSGQLIVQNRSKHVNRSPHRMT